MRDNTFMPFSNSPFLFFVVSGDRREDQGHPPSIPRAQGAYASREMVLRRASTGQRLRRQNSPPVGSANVYGRPGRELSALLYRWLLSPMLVVLGRC